MPKMQERTRKTGHHFGQCNDFAEELTQLFGTTAGAAEALNWSSGIQRSRGESKRQRLCMRATCSLVQDLREATRCERLKLASEEAFKRRFPDCEIGAMPPFGNLYGMEVYMAQSLSVAEDIAFNAGTHTEVIKMAYRDFERLVHPKVVGFTTWIQ